MKNKIEHYARNLNKFETVTFINAAWYLENFLNKEVAPIFGGFPYYPDEECYLTFRVPNWGGDNLVPFLSTEDDFGDIVQGIFLDPARWNGRVVHGVSEILSFSDLVSCFEEGNQFPFQRSEETKAIHCSDGQKSPVCAHTARLGGV